MPARSIVGLDIGTAAVRAAELSSGRDGWILQRFGQVGLPPGAVRDGEVLDAVVVAAALKELWSRSRFRTRRVVVGVANQKVVVRQVDLPWLPPAELKASLQFQAQDFIPMAVDQSILDLVPVEEHVSDQGQRILRGLLVAAARDMVGGLMTAVTSSGLKPVMVDLTPFALLRSAARPDPLGLHAAEAEALVDIGQGVTNIVVHQGGVPRFVRILLMGGGDVTEALADRLGVPHEQAESIKRTVGLTGSARSDVEPITPQVIERAATAFVEEVRSTLDYYLAQPSSVRLNRLVLSGGGSQLAGLPDRLAHSVRLPVEQGNPLSRVALAPKALTPEQVDDVAQLMTVPVGLALGAAA